MWTSQEHVNSINNILTQYHDHTIWIVQDNVTLPSQFIITTWPPYHIIIWSFPRPFELRNRTSTLPNVSEFFSFSWCYIHQSPKEAINPSNSTICANLQAQETKPLELQLLTKNTHTMYPQSYHIAWTKCLGSRRMDVVFMV